LFRGRDARLRPFDPPEQAPCAESSTVTEGKWTHDIQDDLATGETVRAFAADFNENDALTRIESTGLDIRTPSA
jgi:hypothetical protein